MKLYIKPIIDIYVMDAEDIIATSDPYVQDSVARQGAADLSDGNDYSNGGDGLSKSRTFDISIDDEWGF